MESVITLYIALIAAHNIKTIKKSLFEYSTQFHLQTTYVHGAVTAVC